MVLIVPFLYFSAVWVIVEGVSRFVGGHWDVAVIVVRVGATPDLATLALPPTPLLAGVVAPPSHCPVVATAMPSLHGVTNPAVCHLFATTQHRNAIGVTQDPAPFAGKFVAFLYLAHTSAQPIATTLCLSR